MSIDCIVKMAIVPLCSLIDQPLASIWGISRSQISLQLAHLATSKSLPCCLHRISAIYFLIQIGHLSYSCIISEVWYLLFPKEYRLFSFSSKLLLLPKPLWTLMYVPFLWLHSHSHNVCSHIKPSRWVRLVLTVLTILAPCRLSALSI